MISTTSNLSRFFLDKDELADLLGRSRHTLCRRLRTQPESLPPFVEIGRKRLFFRDLAFVWLRGELDKENASVSLNIVGFPGTLGVAEFASLLHFAPATIYALKTKDSFLPQPGKFNRWDTRCVLDWIISQVKAIKPEQIEVISPALKEVSTAELLMLGQGSNREGRGR